MNPDFSRLKSLWGAFRGREAGPSGRLRRTVWAILGGICAVGGGGWVGVHLLNSPVSDARRVREVVVERGMPVQKIGALLEREGLIRSAFFFSLAAYFSPVGRRIQAGVHDVDGGATTTAILRSLGSARDLSRSVTIPEGLSLKEVAALLQREVGLDAGRFVAACTDGAFCGELGVEGASLEGYLFPETYRVPPYPDERRVARLMVAQFLRVFDGAMRARADALRMPISHVVTLASIVEREARQASERPVIAGVFHRRLRIGMRLESDPTTEYALGVHKPHLYESDIAVDSPYNTYRYRGLPPGPIANPGRASLQATLYPVDLGYLFFVARGDGTHIFSRTKQEHDRARAQVKKEQKKLLTAKGAREGTADNRR